VFASEMLKLYDMAARHRGRQLVRSDDVRHIRQLASLMPGFFQNILAEDVKA
ncbi:unnamed protein product, partial [Effrenium voratum]